MNPGGGAPGVRLLAGRRGVKRYVLDPQGQADREGMERSTLIQHLRTMGRLMPWFTCSRKMKLRVPAPPQPHRFALVKSGVEADRVPGTVGEGPVQCAAAFLDDVGTDRERRLLAVELGLTNRPVQAVEEVCLAEHVGFGADVHTPLKRGGGSVLLKVREKEDEVSVDHPAGVEVGDDAKDPAEGPNGFHLKLEALSGRRVAGEEAAFTFSERGGRSLVLGPIECGLAVQTVACCGDDMHGHQAREDVAGAAET
jgi:hypothetical protein